MRTATHTFALLALSPAAYAEISEKLHAAGYGHAFQRVQHDGGGEVDAIDMHGIAVYVDQPLAPEATAFRNEDPEASSPPAPSSEQQATSGFEWVEVTSRNIARAAWADNRLRVQFHSGATFEYQHVTRSWFDAFLGAESKGRFFNEVRLNPTAYPWTRIEA